MVYRYKQEVHGKIVDEITVTTYPEWRCITVRFNDQTAMSFTLTPQLQFQPELIDWSTEDAKDIKRFPAIKDSL